MGQKSGSTIIRLTSRSAIMHGSKHDNSLPSGTFPRNVALGRLI